MASSGVKLISALRKTKSRSALYDVPAVYFSPEEKVAFDYIVSFVESHGTWPMPQTLARQTGITPVIVKEPLAYYMDDCRKRALWQSMLEPFKDIRGAIETKDPDRALETMRRVLTASNTFNSRREGLTTLAESMGMVQADYDIAKRSIGIRGVPTSFPFLDESTDGFQNSNLYTFVARTGIGKTFLLLAFAAAAHRAGYKVLFLSMEMGIIQVARRMFGLLSGYNPSLIRKGTLSTNVEYEMRRQIEAYQDEEGAPFHWLAGNFKKTVDALKIAAYETQPDIIFADASYLLKPSDRTKSNARHELINDVMEGIADITTSLDRPVVQSVQFNRLAIKPKKGSEDETERRNPVSHLDLTKIGGSDTIGQISAYVGGLALGDPPHEADERYCGTLKGREGESGWFKYNYKFQPVNFSQISDHTQVRDADAERGEAPDLSYMDAEV